MKRLFSQVLLAAMFSIFLPLNHTAYATGIKPPGILVLGDSLSGAYGINIDQGWVALLQQQITSEGYDYRVINASISGDTTRTGLGRIDAALKRHTPEIVVIALGGNDGLRGLAFSEIENSLASIIERCKKDNSKILLVGVRLPPNYGAVYNRKFTELYQQLAVRYDIPLVPRMLDQVADHPELMQQDGIHPAAQAQQQVMKNVWSGLRPIIKRNQTDNSK